MGNVPANFGLSRFSYLTGAQTPDRPTHDPLYIGVSLKGGPHNNTSTATCQTRESAYRYGHNAVDNRSYNREQDNDNGYIKYPSTKVRI